MCLFNLLLVSSRWYYIFKPLSINYKYAKIVKDCEMRKIKALF